MDKTRIRIEFAIVGESFDIEDVSKKLNINPTKYNTKQNAISKKMQKGLRLSGYESTYWTYSTEYKETMITDDLLSEIVGLFSKNISVLKEIARDNKIEYFINIIIEIENREVPSMEIKRNAVTFANEIGAEFSIDLYILS